MTSPTEPGVPTVAGETPRRNASVAVVGAGDYIGAAIAQRFARGGYIIYAGRHHGDKVAPLVSVIEAEGGRCVGRALDARQEESITRFIDEANDAGPLEVVAFNIGANVNFQLLETTESVFTKIWALSFDSAFQACRGHAHRTFPHDSGSIFVLARRREPAWRVARRFRAKFGLRARRL
jgi:NAD(P)-dependent dehydrogenase (short-subunit alcohol dehydrogenase family)